MDTFYRIECIRFGPNRDCNFVWTMMFCCDFRGILWRIPDRIEASVLVRQFISKKATLIPHATWIKHKHDCREPDTSAALLLFCCCFIHEYQFNKHN